MVKAVKGDLVFAVIFFFGYKLIWCCNLDYQNNSVNAVNSKKILKRFVVLFEK